MQAQDTEMLQMFLEESKEHLANLEPNLLVLEESQDNPDPELVNEIFRAVHSLKGAAGFFGFKNITDLSHVMESLLSKVRDNEINPNSAMITTLLKGNDKLNVMINDINESENVEIKNLVTQLEKFITNPTANNKVKLEVENEEVRKNMSQKLADQFEIDVTDLQEAISHGHFIYTVKAFTKKDMKNKDKTPINYIKNIKKIGNLMASYSDISSIGGLSDDISDKEIAFVYLFSSVLEPDLISLGLEVDEDQINKLDVSKEEKDAIKKKEQILEKNKKKTKKEKPKKAKKEKTKKVQKEKPKKAKKEEPEKNKKIEPKEKTKKKKVVKKKTNKKKISAEETIRVNVRLLNDLMTLAGELVLGRNQLLRVTEKIKNEVPGLPSILQNINMTTSSIQEKVMDTRMQPIGLVFNKFPRVVRDLSNQLDKKIDLTITGKDVDLDKSIIENLSDPLTHLIRNSADHGLETPEERLKVGKAETGQIFLKAYHESGKVNIEVSDDGKGLDVEAIKNKAIKNGIVNQTEANQMDKKKIFALIFEPGFSTAKQVSGVSGRGVGMDVVNTNIEKIGGTITIDSAPNEGTTIKLNLPLTLAIISSLIIESAEKNFAIPQVNLEEIVRIAPNEIEEKIEKIGNAPVLRLRNKLLALVFLDKIISKDIKDIKKEKKSLRILVLKHDENEFGLVVDKITSNEEIVVKSLPRFFSSNNIYTGTTIMGDGSVALILDVPGLADNSNLKFSEIENEISKNKEKDDEKSSSDTQNILIFENAKDEFFALNLGLIKRIEKISLDEIERVGQKEYIEHEGKSLRIIHLEHYLPVNAYDSERENPYIYVIIPKMVENPIGIISHNIVDSETLSVDIDTENITSRGLIGSSLIKDRLVLFPDIYELIEMAEPEKSQRLHLDKNKSKKVLVVDDTPFFRTLVKQYLSSAGYTIETAFDGLDGLKKAEMKNYDLFVVDILMPRMNGYEFVKSIRRNENLKEIPAIALTTLSNKKNRDKAFEVGFNDYEIKMHKDVLLEKISKLLE